MSSVIFEGTTAMCTEAVTLISLFEEQVAKTPHRRALYSGQNDVSFAELNAGANRLARSLLRTGIRNGDVVGTSFYRSIEAIIGIIAVLKIGAAYLPIAPDAPKHRRKFMIDDSGA